MAGWKAVGVVVEGQPIQIEGVNPWELHWNMIEQTPVELPHPCYPSQRHSFFVYEVDDEGRKAVFAAGELSANVWGFTCVQINDLEGICPEGALVLPAQGNALGRRNRRFLLFVDV